MSRLDSQAAGQYVLWREGWSSGVSKKTIDAHPLSSSRKKTSLSVLNHQTSWSMMRGQGLKRLAVHAVKLMAVLQQETIKPASIHVS